MLACRSSCLAVWCVLVVGVVVVGAAASQLTPPSPQHHHGPSSSPPPSPPPPSTSTLPTDTFYEDYDYDYDYHNDDRPLKNLSFTRLLFFCEYLYTGQYGSYEGLTDAVLPYKNSSVTVISDQRLISICLPHYNLFSSGRCFDKPFITSCLYDDIVFLYGHQCSRPSPDDAYFYQLLAITLLEENETCFQAVCRGEVRVVRREVQGHTVHLFSPVSVHGACLKYMDIFYPAEWYTTSTVSQNVHWSFCLAGYDVVWSRGPSGGGGEGEVINTWSYLPLHCRTRELIMAAVMTVVVVGGVAGNLVVMMASAWRGHQRDSIWMLCVSLAVAELLVCVFVLAPGLHAHLSVMQGEEQLSPDSTRGSDAQLLLDIGMQQVEGGFRMLSAHVLNAGCVVSMPTVLLLALEQCLALSGTSLREELTLRRTRGFVAASWSFGVLVSVALVYGSGAFWYSFYKLPLSVPAGEAGAILSGAALVLGLTSAATVILSCVAVWRTLGGRGMGGIHHRTVTVVVTAVFHLVSAGAAGSAFLLPLTGDSRPHMEGTRCLCWWGFLASTCWHPWLLSLPHRYFRESAMALAARCRLSWLGRLLGIMAPVPVAPSPPLSPRPPPRPLPKLAPGRRHRFLPGVRYYK